jgi:hypothetical protein
MVQRVIDKVSTNTAYGDVVDLFPQMNDEKELYGC